MTTAQPPTGPVTRPALAGPVVRATFLLTLVAGLLLTGLAALLAGSSAALGAGIGTATVCLFFGFGAVVMNAVTTLAPAASLLIALLTYSLKVVLLGVLFLALSRSGALDHAVDARWLGLTVIGGTLVWLTAQMLMFARTRQPLYDLPADGDEAAAR
jgi:ATP synthase protein I